jgi:hypothetical protein
MQHKRICGLCFLLLVLLDVAFWNAPAIGEEALTSAAGGDNGSATSTSGSPDITVTLQEERFGEPDDGQQSFEESVAKSVTSLFDAVQNNTGIISLNQSSGNFVQQSNIRAFYLSEDPDTVFDVGVGRTAILDLVSLTESGVSERRNLLIGSFNDNNVLVGINQSAGNLNQQGNSAIVIFGGLAALNDAELNNTRATNSEIDENQVEVLEDMIANSFVNSQGIFQVSQASGSVNIQENNLAISYRQLFFE